MRFCEAFVQVYPSELLCQHSLVHWLTILMVRSCPLFGLLGHSAIVCGCIELGSCHQGCTFLVLGILVHGENIFKGIIMLRSTLSLMLSVILAVLMPSAMFCWWRQSCRLHNLLMVWTLLHSYNSGIDPPVSAIAQQYSACCLDV